MVRVASPLIALGLLALCATQLDARPATISDFAICNREAAETAGAPAALPEATDPDRNAAPRPAPHVGPKTPEAAPAPSAPSGGMASGTDSSGKIVAGPQDPLLEGLAAEQADDPGYQTAYRECMTRRGVTGRPDA